MKYKPVDEAKKELIKLHRPKMQRCKKCGQRFTAAGLETHMAMVH